MICSHISAPPQRLQNRDGTCPSAEQGQVAGCDTETRGASPPIPPFAPPPLLPTRRSRVRRRNMESAASRGGRYSAPARVAPHKLGLGGDIAAVISIPHRTRPRPARDDADTNHRLSIDPDASLIDLSSLSGTTAASSPTRDEWPRSDSPSSALRQRLRSNSTDYSPCAATHHITLKAQDGDEPLSIEVSMRDLSFRKHNRGIGSIDSILTSTTCVNPQSECSRPASRVSRAIRHEIDALPDRLMHDEASKYTYGQDSDGVVLLDSPTPRHAAHFAPANGPAFSPIMLHTEHEDEDIGDEEARVASEISSWILRNLWGKEVDECAAPLLISDCTHRYLQELWTAAEEGQLRQAGTTPDQASSSPYSGVKQELDSNQTIPPHNGSGKGKRKAGGGNDDDDGYGDQDGRRDEGDNKYAGAQRQGSRLGSASNFSCPYRKRNPRRFNVRDYYVCATHSFADMSQLK